jgi:hypothetical protein
MLFNERRAFRMPKSLMPKLVLILFLALGFAVIQQCEEGEEEGDNNPIQAQITSSCASCHTDSEALQALATEETGGGESAGEG